MMTGQTEFLKAQLELANNALIEIAAQLGFDHFADDEVAIAIEGLLATKAFNEVEFESTKTELEITKQKMQQFSEGVLERDRTIQGMKVLLQDVRNMHALAQGQIAERDQSLNNVAFRLGFQHFSDDEVLARINQLMEKTEEFSEGVLERDRTISNYHLELEDRDRKIEILEDNLDRARSEHLGQLEAISQMLEPLATHEDKGSLYLSHFGKAAMVYLIQRVIYANIEKLDPDLKSYGNNF